MISNRCWLSFSECRCAELLPTSNCCVFCVQRFFPRVSFVTTRFLVFLAIESSFMMAAHTSTAVEEKAQFAIFSSPFIGCRGYSCLASSHRVFFLFLCVVDGQTMDGVAERESPAGRAPCREIRNGTCAHRPSISNTYSTLPPTMNLVHRPARIISDTSRQDTRQARSKREERSWM